MEIFIGFLLSTIISLVAYRKKSLDLSGLVMAVIMGTLIYFFGTYIVFTLLMLFFISSSIITKFKKDETNDHEKRGRNYIQVIVNSLPALVFCIGYYFTKNHSFLVVAAVAIAASTSDTWASEIGKLSKGNVVSIINFKLISKGESGGISLVGTIASLIGSFFIGIAFLGLMIIEFKYSNQYLIYLIILIFGGFLGSIVDSYMGVLLQGKFLNKETNTKTEKRVKGNSYLLVSGFFFINNDVVNFLSTTIVAIIFGFIVIR
ncbi:DUF92 domain-containing protein [Haploplasma axanthum]|uniref:Integral membrane protein DUF92 n=1 Tax=Haploplasma axanthum TaxID=29552 RepID=A0A449BFK2_HAPAX|nr:DUF92 domain-containing protein [Haploplasma axanthum]VEU81237.1 Integral membrane protein DUF92 [Haploplasma axanthum]